MAYITYDDVITLISQSEIIPFLDDYGTGVADLTLLNSIIGMASNEANSYVASIYPVPFNPVPSKIKTATLIFTCEAIYTRRLTPDEKNPFKSRADMWRKLLEAVGSGTTPLDESFTRGFLPGAAITFETIWSVDRLGQPLSLM